MFGDWFMMLHFLVYVVFKTSDHRLYGRDHCTSLKFRIVYTEWPGKSIDYFLFVSFGDAFDAEFPLK
jgi:hypothetical protein